MSSYAEVMNGTVIRTYDEGFPLLMPRWGYVASAFALFLIGFFGFFLNLMVILLMFKDRQLWTPLNIILFNLVCSDFSVSVLGNPFTLISALFHRWVFGHTMCTLYGFFMALLGIASITTLTVLSFERYLIVTRPLTTRHLTSKGAIASIVFIWTYSLALTTPPLLGWGNYVHEAANISCSVNWHEQSINTLTYILFLFAMGQIVPFMVITFSYVNIIRTMKKNSQRLGRVSRAEAKVTTMVFVMILAFTVAWTPYSVFALMEQFATDGIISPGAGVIPALVAKSSICYNPLIYVGMNTQFRQSIKRLFGIHSKGAHSQIEKGYDNTLMSPSHKLSCTNDVTIRYNSSESNPSNGKKHKNKKITVNDSSEATNDEINQSQPRNELDTIHENKMILDPERSGDTLCKEDSNTNNKKMDPFGESCNFLNKNSPILTIVNSEKIIYSKIGDGKSYNETECSNKAFEDATDVTKDMKKSFKKKKMKHSYSLDLSSVSNENKNRMKDANFVSIETKFDSFIQSQGLFKNTVVSKFFDRDSKQGPDSFKSYLCRVDRNESEDNNL